MFFRRRLHKLPKFPPNLIPTFRGLCIAVQNEEIPDLRVQLDAMFERMLKEGKRNPLFDPKMARAIQERCRHLLSVYAEQSPENKALIIGAIRYSAAEDDAFSDENFATGMNDDAKIINHVLEELGIFDQFIEME